MADNPFEDDYSELMPSLSPYMSSGLDPDDVIASGDPQGMLAAKRAGVAYQTPAQKEAQASPAASMLAQSSQAPATNAPNPASEHTGNPVVPATVTPSGTAQPSFLQQAQAGSLRAGQNAEKLANQIQGQPSVSDTLAPLESQRANLANPQSATNPTGIPNPRDAQYRPSVGRRIGRGALAALEGLARGGIRGATLGALDPAAVGATAYGAGNPAWSAAARANTQRTASLDQQIAEGEKAQTADTARLKDTLAAQKDVAGVFSDAAKNAYGGQGKANTVTTQLAKSGLKPVMDANGNVTGVENDENSEVFKGRKVMDDLRETQQELNDAKTAVEQAKNDPNSPAYKLALKRAETASGNMAAAQTRAQAYMGNYLQHSKNVDLQGNVLPGAPIISNDTGDQTVVGSTNANTAIKNQSNAAQFNDVHGALDDLETKAKALVSKGGSLNSPAVAAALARPTSTLGKWLQGEGVKSNLSPEERAYVQSIASAHENVQALRKSAGGTATDSAVEKLDSMIPNASTPDLNYLLGQTGQIRNTAQRLGKGATQAAGGLHVKGQGKDSSSASSGKGVSLAAARDLPQNKGKSDDEIRKDIESHGHVVTK